MICLKFILLKHFCQKLFSSRHTNDSILQFLDNPMKLKPSDDNRWLPNTLPATPPCSRQAWRVPPWQNSS